MPRPELKQRVAVIEVDGADTIGGLDSIHMKNPASAELLLRELGLREDCAAWDEFHKLDAPGRKVFNTVPMAREFFDVVREVGNKFAFGQGIQMDRNISAALSRQHLVTKSCAGTRKIVRLRLMLHGARCCWPLSQCLQFGILLGCLSDS